MADTKTPYGPKSKVEYADPGYQSDGKARYPLDNYDHAKAAWGYINQAGNADKYTPAQLARIKARIKAACRRFGIEISEDAGKKISAAEMRGIELARPGRWKLSSGEITFTEDMLIDAARHAQRAGTRPWPVKIGHVDPRFDGEPALGWVGNVRVEDRDELVLVGDITDMPDWLAAAAPKAWPYRSIEGWADYTTDDGEKYSFVGEALALLGVTPPGMPSLQSLRDLPKAVGVAASSGATRIVASLAAPPAPAPTADVSPPNKGAGMSLVKYREALAGLPDDASEDDVRAALESAGLTAPAPPAPEPVTASSSQELDQRIAAAAAKGGVITIDAATVAQFQEGMVRAAALAKRLDEQDRDTTITAAVKAGKFPPARRPHYERMWDADPKGTKELIASLAAGLVPITASGYAGDAERQEDELDREIARLSDPSRKAVHRG